MIMTRFGHEHICGFYYIAPSPGPALRSYLPQVRLAAHTTIVSTTSRTVLTQTFVNPQQDRTIPELRYTFPLYDGVSVVGFTCTIDNDRVIRGVVKERNEARKAYRDAVDRGDTAGLLEQLPEASDVFTTTIGNVSGAELKVELTYLGELKHDAEVDGIRFTIPTSVAPRYGDYPGRLAEGSNVSVEGGISIVVDAEMPGGSNIKSVQSPSHPISVTVGNTAAGASSGADMSLQKASATLSLGSTELDHDFVLQVVATNTGSPVAVLETHPTIPNHRAIMTTLVPKFSLPSSRPEIVFVCDRSGSMDSGTRMQGLKAALHIFLKSLPLGVKFNVCSFGSRHELLFKNGSVAYDAVSLKEATSYIETFSANFGGTEMYRPLEEVLMKRYKDMDLEIFLLTDGEVWNQADLFGLIDTHVRQSKGATRVFTLGIGDGVSHALIEGLAVAGNGFAQTVTDHEQMNSKVVRMLKAALTPHILDYMIDVKYAAQPDAGKQVISNSTEDGADGFEIVEKVMDALSISVTEPVARDEDEKKAAEGASKQPISLFDPAADPDVDLAHASEDKTAGGRYAGVPIVSEPQLLQAPYVIPPLYPFSRTTVYVLLSADTTQRTPTSVVVRGTSIHGPLELEIPVTVLSEPAETIHQLAARKAIRELEDGRGWIFHAKAAVDKGEGRLLKDTYPGRFSDMVEREMVRLGVTYQVGGKSCSFVAVDEQEVAVQPSSEAGSMETGRGQGWGKSHGVPVASFAMPQMQFASYTPPSGAVPAPRAGLFSVRSNRMRTGAVQARLRPTEFGGGLQVAGGGQKGSMLQTASLRAPRKLLTSPAAPRAPALPPAPSPAADPHPPLHDEALLEQSRVEMSSAAHMPVLDDEDDDSDGDCGHALFDSPIDPTTTASSAARAHEVDALETVVSLQTFEGYWQWDESLFQNLGVDCRKVLSEQSMKQSAALATAIVLNFMEEKLAERKDEWEMLAEKARDWLKIKLQPRDVQEYLNLVADLLG
jgi:hypothetical protein